MITQTAVRRTSEGQDRLQRKRERDVLMGWLRWWKDLEHVWRQSWQALLVGWIERFERTQEPRVTRFLA